MAEGIPLTKKLKKAEDSPQEKICHQHDKLSEIYCQKDHSWICYLCKMNDHKLHSTAAAVTERTDLENDLSAFILNATQIISKNRIKAEELKKAVNNIKFCAHGAVEESEKIFKELIISIAKWSSEVKHLIEDQKNAEVKRAEILLEQLDQENSVLEKSISNMEHLSEIQDHIYFIESFKSLKNTFVFENPPNIAINGHFSFDELKKSFSELKNQIEEFCKETLNNVPSHVVTFEIISPSEPKSRTDLLKYISHLTLDLNTAHPNLQLSEKNQTVSGSQIQQQYSRHSERFEDWLQVLCKERLRGRCYWEVQWIGDVFLSVSYKGISRKGCGSDCVFGFNHYSWSLEIKSSSIFFWHNNKRIELQVPIPNKIGVYVDQRSGILSFYNVSNTIKLLHSIQTTFSQPLYAGFRLNFNSTVKLCDPKYNNNITVC